MHKWLGLTRGRGGEFGINTMSGLHTPEVCLKKKR